MKIKMLFLPGIEICTILDIRMESPQTLFNLKKKKKVSRINQIQSSSLELETEDGI